MKTLIAIVFALSASAGTVFAANTAVEPVVEQQIVEHGGGCRKSSPPGMCCHMDNSTVRVHCQ